MEPDTCLERLSRSAANDRHDPLRRVAAKLALENVGDPPSQMSGARLS